MPLIAQESRQVIVFLVRHPVTGVMSYCWRIGVGRTSFYMKPRYDPLSMLKISFHGPDPRHRQPGLKIEIDQSASTKANEAGGIVVHGSGEYKQWYTGKPVRPGGPTHVARLRYPWSMFYQSVPSAPMPKDPPKASVAGVIPPPDEFYAVDVDLYISQGKPYWPDERAARRANAMLGVLRNEADQYLTAVANHHSVIRVPTPDSLVVRLPSGAVDIVRALGTCVHDDVLWVCEQRMSSAQLREARDQMGAVPDPREPD
jgi:hypothetical protein